MDAMLRSLQPTLHRQVRAIVRDDHLAEDVLQEVLWIVCRKLGWLRDPRWIRAWALRIATREAIRRVRRERGRIDTTVEESPEPIASDPSDAPPGAELLARLPLLLDSLSPASEAVVRLHYLEELTIAEIAEALELSSGTVKSRLNYGLQSLRRRLSRSAQGRLI
jgi:RNA polymerase sigma factor (sigma-70 family)